MSAVSRPEPGAAGLQRRWRALVDERLPEAAAARADWPVRLNHCFARILLDNACGGPWRESVAPPAWANMPPTRLAAAVALGEAVLAGEADLADLNRRSLAWRGRRRSAAPPGALAAEGFCLRRWRRADDAPFAALNADPEVMRFFPAPKSRRESEAEARALDRRFEQDGFGPWALEARGTFVGFVGCWRPVRPLPFAAVPGSLVEIGWRLARDAWGQGLATAAARLALADAFGRCGLTEIVAYTALLNRPSQRVMERLGMERVEDFAHPALADGDPLRPHVLYRLSAAAFAAGGAA
ncbi:GCN5-related N-acetyltransferase [Methylobacterium sp. 4-46]|uniref:GNAT family N-acetyltransferase n=1 Tax=unclassified Methylobacterium TaxID=2615210 RepID=UPI000165CDC1|nr:MULTISPECIES: GNAT family N-acetyltransferase [Methylobacterium]ACA18873.1 GCN5-related N-acetyltransferase [Methylobacterium sp. 4-46]WFT78098.1 GNAT family N-acetyltransferase [Methylobacterium nodulans]